MKKIKLSLISIAIATVLLLSGCATSIATTVQRPAELDMNGANSISILPFQTSSWNDDNSISILGLIKITFESDKKDPKKEITQYLTYNLTDSLLNSTYMNVIGSKIVEKAIENGTEIPADCYLSGYITNFNDTLNRYETDEEYEDGNPIIDFSRSVSFKVVYQVIDATTNRIICSKYNEISKTSMTYHNSNDVPETLDVVKNDLDMLISRIMKELQPYEETKYLSLLDDKNNKDSMNAAKAMAKSGDIEMAKEMYMNIYESTNSFEAGYNAGQLMQVLGEYDDAELLMSNLLDATGNKKAAAALRDIKAEKQYQQTLKSQKESKENNNHK